MKHHLMQLTARIRAICILFALLMVPGMVQATDYYLVGDFNYWTTSDAYKFNVSGTTATLSLTGAQINSGSTEFLIEAVESSSKSWYLKNSSFTTVTVNGVAVTASSAYNNYEKCNYKVSGLSTVSTTTYTFTLTANGSDINNSQLKITSSTTSSGGGGSSTTTTAADGYYLVTNFVGGTNGSTNTDGNSINYNRTIFKFKEQEDGSYSFSIPASLTGHAQILGVSNGKATVYGPGEANYGIHAATSTNSTGWPDTDKSVSASLSSSTTLAEGSNYWGFETRNNGTSNDDGMYTISFTVTDGVPSKWTIKHVSTRRVAYVVNADMSEPVQPLYDYRHNSNDGFDDKFLGSVYIDPAKAYYVLGNYVINESYLGNAQTLDATAVDPGNEGPTVNKLMLQGNGAKDWLQSNDQNLVYPNKSTFNPTSTTEGVYILEYNPSKGKDGGNYGLGGEIWLFSGAPKFNSVSMVGTTVGGTTTTSGSTTTWDYASTAGDMTYDKANHCYTLTLNTTAKDGATSFRFVANHSATTTWHEEDNTAANAARTPYDGSSTTGHTATVNDPNVVSYASTDDTGTTDVNIVFNRPGGNWTVKFYIEATNENNNASYKYYYTIEGTATPVYATIVPPTSTINYGEYVTPAISVVDANYTSGALKYVYTLDGSEPAIKEDGTASNGTVVEYTPDAVINASTLGTFHMNGSGNIVMEGSKTSPIDKDASSFTVKAYAIGLKDVDSKTYEVQGNLATATYTFKKAGGQTPTASYSISVTNDNTTGKPSVNKVTATVDVKNTSTNTDDGLDVYYTSDGSDPAISNTRHLVRNRKITLYALGQDVSASNKIWVCIAGSAASETADGTTHASCDYDVTYSTSEGGYQNYLNNNQNAKTLGGQGHVIVYVKPSDTSADTYVYAYENVTGSDGTTTAKLMTPKQPGRKLTDADKTTVNGETWYYLDGETSDGFKEINLQLSTGSLTGYVTVANVCHDVFLEFNTSTGVITDVTPAYAGDYFYSVGTDDTKAEAANPTSASPFIYVQVPSEWASGNVTVKLLDSKDTEISGATYTKQDGAETSANSVCYKISGLSGLTDGTTTIKFAPYNTSTSSYGTVANHSFSATYMNGGYYYYESQSVNGLGLVFSPADTKTDFRSKGHHDINHVTTGDKTYYLANSWTYSPKPASGTSKTTTITDNWNKAASATVNVIPSGTTISQTVNGLSTDSTYTVQMIVRGKSGAKGTMTLEGATTTTDELTLTGYDVQGVITADGRVEYLLNNETTKNGWQKLEASVQPATDGTVTVKLTANDEEMQLSDVTLLENANTKGHVWTTVPTSNTQTEYDLSSRATANAFSFFDRGKNRNAIIYANDSTVLGMSKNTYDVAVAIPASSPAKAIHRASSEAEDAGAGSEASSVTPKYSMHTFAITDQAQDGTRNTDGSGSVAFWATAWKYGVSNAFKAEAFAFDRHFTKDKRSTICLPVALSQDEVKSIFGTDTKFYDLKSVDVKKYTIDATQVTEDGMKADHPYIIYLPDTYDFGSVKGSFTIPATSTDAPHVALSGGYTFYGNYEQDSIFYNNKEKCYNFGSAEGGRFYRVKVAGVVSKPFRAYIKADNPLSSLAKMFVLNIVDDTTTGIEKVEEASDNADGPVYTLTGVRVAEKFSSTLPPGIYIQNGRKVIVK